MNTVSIMGYDIYAENVSTIKLEESKQIINTVNPHSYIVAKNDKLFSIALHSSDIILPDGSGFVIAGKFINNTKIKKIAGADIHSHLLKILNQSGGSCFYMGSSNNTLNKIKEKIKYGFPNIKISIYSPPYKDKFSEEENNNIIDAINKVKPDVLFVGMTAPKQEKWLHENQKELDFKIATSIGAVFDFYAGTIKRPSNFWIDLHLEWLPRFLNEPKRLWKRNLVSTPLFLIDMLIFKLKKKRKRGLTPNISLFIFFTFF